MPASSMHVAFTKAFEAWENEFREHPERFMTEEETAALAVLPLSEQRAEVFEAILNTLSAGRPWESIDSSPRVQSREAAARARAEDFR